MFPLPLAPFELLMLRDDCRSDYPMWFELATDFSGAIDRSRFEEAVRLVQERHPLTSAQVVEVNGYPHWTRLKTPAQVVYWALEDDPAVVSEFYCLVSLEETIGFRVLVQKSENLIRIIWRFHHASTDGVGACIVIGDALAIYHGLTTNTDWTLRLTKLEPEKLVDRAKYRPSRVKHAPTTDSAAKSRVSVSWRERIRSMFKPVQEAVHLLVSSPQTISCCRKPSPLNVPRSLLTKTLSRQQTEQIRAVSRSLNVTVNDLLMAGLFRTIVQWNSDQTLRAPHGFIRITMPTNLRSSEDKKMPAANRMSYAFLDRDWNAVQDWTSLVAGLHFASQAIIRWNLSLQFLKTLSVFAKWPALIRYVILGRGCFSSAVLSNLGDPTRRFEASLQNVDGKIIAGDMTLESIYAAPPVRPRTSLAIAVCHYRDCLTLGAMYDSTILQPNEGYAFLGKICDAIIQVDETTA